MGGLGGDDADPGGRGGRGARRGCGFSLAVSRNVSWFAAAEADAILSVYESLCLRELPEVYGGSGAGLGFDGRRGRFRYTCLLGVLLGLAPLEVQPVGEFVVAFHGGRELLDRHHAHP